MSCSSESTSPVLFRFCLKATAVNQDERSRSGQFWLNPNKCTVNTWQAGLLSNRSQMRQVVLSEETKGSSKTRHWGHGWMDSLLEELHWDDTSESWEFPDRVSPLFISVFSPLAAVNHRFSLLFIKWVLMYRHNPATSLTFRDPAICVHFCILSKLFCLKGASLVWRLFWWRLLGVSGQSHAGIPVGLCLLICESSSSQWSLCIRRLGLLMSLLC